MIKKLAKSIREYKKPAILAPLFVSLEVIMEVLIPILMSKLIDDGIKPGDMNALLVTSLLLILCCGLSLLFGILSGRFAAIAACGFAANLRQDMYENTLGFSFANIDKFSTASIVTRLTTDVSNVQNSFAMIIRIAVRAPLMLIVSLAAAIFISPKLSVVFLVALPILGIGMFLIVSKAHPVFRNVFKTYDKLNGVVQENLRGIRVVKSYVCEDRENEKFKGVSGGIYKLFCKAEKLVSYNNPLMLTCIYAVMLAVAFFGASIIVSSGGTELTTGYLTSLIAFAMQMMMSLMMLSMIFVMLTISRASAERVTELLDEKSSITSPENALTEVKDGRVDFDSVSFKYSAGAEKNTLEDIELHIPSGAVVGIIGGTGSAKTTLVQLLPRLYDVCAGSVKIGGVDVRDYDLTALRDAVAIVLQKNELFSGTVAENLRWGNESAADDELVEACRIAQADKFISEMPDGYNTKIEQGGTNVSGGQKQRLCIARALLKHPKVLVFDDSTSAVDTQTDAMLRKGLADYAPDTTKIIIAQRIISVQDADLIVVLDGGRINGVGAHDELLASNAIYREVFTSQTQGRDE